MAKLSIGTGGVPLTTKKRSTIDGIRRIKELGLSHMELEFVRGVRMSKEKAIEVKNVKEEEGVSLTVHGPYYVNLASDKNTVLYGSIKYITDSIYIGGIAGAESVTFHPAFYQKLTHKEAYEKVKIAFEKIYEEFEKEKFLSHSINNQLIAVAPELTGKPTQFGDLEELISLSQDFEKDNLRFCFDFAHKFARSNAKYNGYEDTLRMIEQIEQGLGSEFLERMHIHLSAILHSEKGERNHLTLLSTLDEYKEEGVELDGIEKHFEKLEKAGKNGGSKFEWRGVLKALKEKKVGGWLVCESPILELDALLMQKVYDNS